MREALARSNLDVSTSEPRKGKRAFPETTRLPRILRVASIATAVLVGGVILVNALFLQDRKHPAPLLRAPDPAPIPDAAAPKPGPAPRAAAAPAAPMPPARTANRDPIGDEITRTVSAAERKPARTAAPPSDAPHADAIAGLIGATASPPSTSVLSAQKALLRLGYVVKADGVFGTTTRQAIERYEKDNKLPVRGELTTKMSRELVAKSGL